jgi:hypothetical protein
MSFIQLSQKFLINYLNKISKSKINKILEFYIKKITYPQTLKT